MTAGPDGWWLAPEGAAVHPETRTAVIADVHLGYEWARGAGGDCLPPHSLRETLAKLSTLLKRAAIDRLVVAGDLVESFRPCRRTDRDVLGLGSWLAARGVAFEAIRGNHDPRRAGLKDSVVVNGWTVGHGDTPFAVAGAKTISGHLHPALRFEGLRAPCFLVGPSTIILPAFSPNAAGVALFNLRIPGDLRCLAGMGEELLDFGPVSTLIQRFT